MTTTKIRKRKIVKEIPCVFLGDSDLDNNSLASIEDGDKVAVFLWEAFMAGGKKQDVVLNLKYCKDISAVGVRPLVQLSNKIQKFNHQIILDNVARNVLEKLLLFKLRTKFKILSWGSREKSL